MKKRIMILCAAALVLTATLTMYGCGNKPETPAETQQAETAAPAQADASDKKEETKPQETASDYNFEFTRENFPKMDGSTASVPMARAIASVLLGESPDSVEDLVHFNKTTQSFRNLKGGECDILVVGEPNAAVFKEMEEEGFHYELEEVATDALIFVVNEGNPIDNLATEQIRDIYSGKIKNWKEVGGNDAEIVPFQRNEGAGSQALMLKHVMKDTPLMNAPATLVATEMGELMDVVRNYDNSANAIGYSVYYYANDMKKAKGLKIISVDGVEPNPDTIRDRKYPHLNAYYGVIPEGLSDDDPAKVMYNWLLSSEGQALLESEGYVNIAKPEDCKRELAGGKIVKTDYTFYQKTILPDNIYKRNGDGALNKLAASNDYGVLLPYTGDVLYSSYEDGYAYVSGAMMGFFDANSNLITDPIYNDISPLNYYDGVNGENYNMPIWRIEKIKDNPVEDPEDEEYWNNMVVSFATLDGKKVCNTWYKYVNGIKNHVLCITSPEETGKEEFDIYDIKGNRVLSSRTWPERKRMEAYSAMSVDYGDGMFQITFDDGVYFFDENGTILMGPYGYCDTFCNGKAIVAKSYNDDYHRGVIDKKGNWLIEPKYDYIIQLTNGGYVARNGEEEYDLYDKDCKFKKSIATDSINTANYGFYAEDYGNSIVFYDFDGNELYSYEGGNAYALGRKEIMYRTEGAGVLAYNFITGKKQYFEGFDSMHEFYRMEDTPNQKYFEAQNSYYDYDTDYYYCHSIALDSDFNIVHEEKNGSLNITQDEMTDEWYYTAYRNNGKVVYLDSSFNECMTLPNSATIVGGKFIVTDDYACTCYDKNGDTIFRYSLINSIGD